MSGIGVIIIIQLMPFMGLSTAPGGPVGALRALPHAITQINVDALAIAVASLAVMIFWPRRLRAYLPPPLAALVIGTLLVMTIFKTAPVIGDVPTGLPALHWPSFRVGDLGDLSDIIQTSFVLALLGTIDSLLTSLIADSISRTQISGALHALILLSLVLGLGPLAERIPHAALSGILLKVGWDIIDWGYLKRLRTAPHEKTIVMFVTMGLTVLVDLITAVRAGWRSRNRAVSPPRCRRNMPN
jgi:SulP family sulfate permease